jgi:cytosine/adenosine deaminase-related metal-dependent hydrolase
VTARPGRPLMRDTLVIDGCAVATVDGAGPADAGAEYRAGHVVVAGGRIAAVGAGPGPEADGAVRIDAAGCLATPGWSTRITTCTSG